MSYDVIIAGAGSAGCALAARLSEDPAVSVLLVEAGGSDRRFHVTAPAGFPELYRTRVDWAYETEPQAAMGGRRLFWPRGKMLGGSSSMNAMIYVRGHRATFDDWAARGNEGWGYDDLLPVFKRSERHHAGESPYHGADGTLDVAPPRDPNPMSRAFVDAAAEIGLPPNDDFNGPRQEGIGFYELTQRRGTRCSAAKAFLRPALRRPNLAVRTGTLVARVLFDGGRAVGVETLRGTKRERIAGGRVVLAGGAINSPQILMLSGVGPAAELKRHGIAVVHDLPGVGENLIDHLVVCMNYACRQPISLERGRSLGGLLRFLLRHRGPMTSNVAEAGGFVRLDDGAPMPDLQFHFAPNYFVRHGFDNPPGHGFGMAPTLVQPRSVGRLTLRSADPREPPAIDPRCLDDSADVETLVRGVRLAQRLFRARVFDPYRGAPVWPELEADDEKTLRALVRERAESVYHPVGTCAMGSGPDAVVDPALRVHGVSGLRVADASIMPTITNGNTNAPCIAIGERCADFVSAGG